MKFNITLFFLLYLGYINAQTNNTCRWYFGNKCGLVFKNNVVYNDTFTNIFNNEGTSVVEINDSSFFYSDGRNIYNKKHNIILQGLKSEISSTQGSIMLMHPNNDSVIFMFTNSQYNLSRDSCKTYFYQFKINNDTLLTLIDFKLIDAFGSEKLSATNHKNGKDIWIISHNYSSNIYKLYLLKSNKLLQCISEQTIGTNYNGSKYAAAGQIKFSPSGKYVVALAFANARIDIMNFDNETGVLSNANILSFYGFGCEFSQDEKYLYVSTYNDGGLIQFEMKNLRTDSLNKNKVLISNNGSKKISLLQLAPNGKIYWSNNDSLYLAAIEEPNKKGDNCKLNFRSIYLQGRKSTAGLPTFNQSYFYTPAINYNYEMECINNNIKFWGYDTFAANTHFWQTRKLYSVNSYSLIGTTKDINYTFTDTGSYEIRYIANNGTKKDTIVKTITVYPKINKQFLGKDTTYIQGSAINKTLKAPYSMHCQQWQDSSGLSTFTATKKGIYTCKVTNQAFCEVTDTIEIKECLSLSIPSIYKKLTDSLFCSHQDADTFIWYRNNVPYKTTYAYGTKISNLKLTDTGNYRVEAVKYGHCNRTSATFYINKLGIKGLTIGDFGIKVYPNPSIGIVNIESERNYKLIVTDITGRTILTTENTKQIELPKGVYFLRFEIGEYFTTEKVVVL